MVNYRWSNHSLSGPICLVYYSNNYFYKLLKITLSNIIDHLTVWLKKSLTVKCLKFIWQSDLLNFDNMISAICFLTKWFLTDLPLPKFDMWFIFKPVAQVRLVQVHIGTCLFKLPDPSTMPNITFKGHRRVILGETINITFHSMLVPAGGWTHNSGSWVFCFNY